MSCIDSPQRSTSSHLGGIFALLLSWLCLAPMLVAQPAAPTTTTSEDDSLDGASQQSDIAMQSDTVWITLGEDAFDTLRAQKNFQFDNQPLKVLEERSDVVITQVTRQDLPRISALLHETHLRCAGFMSHRTPELAQKALAQASLPEFRAAPIEYLIDQPMLADRLKARVSQSRILSTIRTLSTDFNNRYFAHPSGRNAAVWIRDQWRQHANNRPDVTVQLYQHPWPQPSVILTIPGSTRADEIVVLGGHLDSITPGNGNPNFIAPGADDNASGIAVLSEVIRAAMESGFRPQRTVKFMAYAAEEVGLDGSQAIAQDFRQQGLDVVAVMQFDMTAFNGSMEDISLLSDFTNNQLTTFTGRLIGRYLPALAWSRSACGYACSDHASWTAAGYPAAMAFEARVGQHNNTIHTTSDTLATLSNTAGHAVKFARLGAVFMAEVGVDGPEQSPVPNAPTQLIAVASSTSTIEVEWTDRSSNETGFEIQGKSDGTFAVLGRAGANSLGMTIDGLDPETDYIFRVRAVGNDGNSAFSNEAEATTFGEPSPCVADDTTLCLNDGRFRVRLDWLDHANTTGAAHAVANEADDSGLLWFFNDTNWEMLIKVIDGCLETQHFWVFAAATTDVGYNLRVTDSLTGITKKYTNPLGTASPAITDTRALATCSAGQSATNAPQGPEAKGSRANLPRYLGTSTSSPVSKATLPTSCTAGSEAMCLNESRFEITVDWEDFAGNTGKGQVVPFGTDDSGLLWFFGADNWEVLVKVIDGCGDNGHFWVFAAATTNVHYALKVIDTETGVEKIYRNPLGTSADAIIDTSAFSTCP